jgi:hypothetical protein
MSTTFREMALNRQKNPGKECQQLSGKRYQNVKKSAKKTLRKIARKRQRKNPRKKLRGKSHENVKKSAKKLSGNNCSESVRTVIFYRETSPETRRQNLDNFAEKKPENRSEELEKNGKPVRKLLPEVGEISSAVRSAPAVIFFLFQNVSRSKCARSVARSLTSASSDTSIFFPTKNRLRNRVEAAPPKNRFPLL